MTRILIGDDHPIVRKGLKEILADAPEIFDVDEASDGPEFVNKVRRNAYDVALLDITMPGMSGLDVLKQLKSEYPALPILILSWHPEEHYAVRALKAGAAGYLTKETAPDELVKAVKKVRTGRKYVSASLAERLAVEIDFDADKPPHESLSDREYQVMCLIASGKTVREIAELLSLSVKTISTYRARILEKMNMKSNAELTHYALKNQLVD